MPILNAGLGSEAQQVASTLLAGGKQLVDKGKQLGGALSGLNALQEDVRSARNVLANSNLSPGEKVILLAHIVRARLPAADAGQTITPEEIGRVLPLDQLTDRPAELAALIIRFVDP